MTSLNPVQQRSTLNTIQWMGWVKTGLLFGLALYFAYNILTGNLTNYINERFAWLSYLAVALFVVLGGANLIELLRQRPAAEDSLDEIDLFARPDPQTHGSGGISWSVLAIIAVPLLLGTLIPSRPLGANAIDGNISISAASVTGAQTFTTDPLKWNVLDWLRAFNAQDDATSFNGKQADVIGFVYKEPTLDEQHFMVARFTVSCCVADAAAIGLPVDWAETAALPQDTWVRVKGSFEVGSFRGDTVPILIAESVEVVTQPEHPYLYP